MYRLTPVLCLTLLLALLLWMYLFSHRNASPEHFLAKPRTTLEKTTYASRLRAKARAAKVYAGRNQLCTRYAFLLDMHLHSGRNRFFIYDLQEGTVLYAGLVAHGSCNTAFLESARFSDSSGCGCSSLGHYRIGGEYEGRFGDAFKLHGLDSTNLHAYQRAIVLHAYDRVPDKELFPYPIGNSLGCPMVSYKFFALARSVIKKEKKPILLWIYN